ncbi:MAG: PstS family phosphate ABC transporter substrate-binding protein [Fimbriimonadaceae bacterium]
MKLAHIAGFAGISALLAGIVIACSPTAEPKADGGETPGTTSGMKADYSGQSLAIDGSGTVYPIGAAAAEMFKEKNPDVKITVGKAGTGGGMKMFIKGETGISDASRPIKDDEIKSLEEAKIEFIEVPIALDGLCVIVNPKNTWLKSITIEQLNKIWNKDSKVKMWNEVDPTWPAEEIKLYGPTDAHGTYEYFNEVVNGKKDNVRPDYSQNAEYDPLVQGVANEPHALGYVGFAYYMQNKEKIRAVPIDGGKGAVEPTKETIVDGTYSPFGRPLFMYVNKAKMTESSLLKDFMSFMLSPDGSAAVEAGDYLPLPADAIEMIKARFEAGTTGSIFNKAEAGQSVTAVLTANK